MMVLLPIRACLDFVLFALKFLSQLKCHNVNESIGLMIHIDAKYALFFTVESMVAGLSNVWYYG